MTSFTATVNKNVKISKPYKNNKEKVKEIRTRLIKGAKQSANDCITAHRKSAEIAKRKHIR